jgi:hypothetical protein
MVKERTPSPMEDHKKLDYGGAPLEEAPSRNDASRKTPEVSRKTPENMMASIQEEVQSDATEEVLIIEESEEEMSQADYGPNMFTPPNQLN